MYKFANQVIDIHDDIYKEHLVKIASKRPQTDVISADQRARLGDDDFALCVITKTANKINKFPINSHDSAWLSNEYFSETCYKLPKTAAVTAASFIKHACEHFGISPCSEVEAMAKEASTNVYFENDKEELAQPLQSKTASVSNPLEAFAEIEKIANNYTHAQYIFRTPAHVKVASKYFEEKHKEMPLETRHKYAAAIQIRAEELGMQPVKGAVSKYASDSYNGMLDGHISSRRRLVEHTPFAGELSKLANARKEFTPYQFAQALHGFDKKAGLERHYDGYLTDPYRSTFAEQPDKLAGYRWMDKKGSRSLTAEEIARVVNTGHPKIAEYIGKHAADELRSNPVPVFDSMPNDIKEIIANIHDGTL